MIPALDNFRKTFFRPGYTDLKKKEMKFNCEK